MFALSRVVQEASSFAPATVLRRVCIIPTIFCALQAHAVTIESSSPGQVTATKNITIPLFGAGVFTFALKATADINAVRYTAAEQCIDVSGTVAGQNITGWGMLTPNLPSLANGSYTAKLTNHCNTELRAYMAIWNVSHQSNYFGDWVTVPANRVCSVNVVTSPAIPDLIPGKAVNAVQITSGSTGTGSLAFKPNATNGSKGTLSDGTHFLTYSIPEAQWDSALGQWSGALGDYTLKLDDIPDPTTAGVYKGTMTATISCQ